MKKQTMKKYIFIAFLSFISLLGTSKTSNDTVVSNIKESVLKAIPDSSLLTFKEVYSDTKSGLTALGSSLKVGSEHVYEVLIKQQLSNSITGLLMLLLSIICLIIIIKITKKAINKNKDLGMVTVVFIGIPTMIFLVYELWHMNDIVTGFINPEYGAIKEILEVIK